MVLLMVLTTYLHILVQQYNALMAKLYNKMEDSNSFTKPEDMDKYVRKNWDDINFDNTAED